ncbi:MAG: tripartite tricarboxylate transporter substrate binding protein [Burkholderiaceae bacterium]
MPISRREWMGMAAATAASGWPALGFAQTLDKPVRVIVAYGAGSVSDILARFLADRIAKNGGRSAVVENKAGADGNIAAEAAARASADAYTLLVSGSSTHAANATIYRKLPFDPEADFSPISTLAVAPFILLVNPQRIQQRSLKDFLSWARAGAGHNLSFASTSVGNRVSGERFRQIANLNAVNVPYRSSGQAMTDLLGGQFDFYFCDVTTALPQIRAGKVVPLAVSVRDRLAALPDVPTLAESGFTDFDIASWIAMWSAVASTPPEVSARLAQWVSEALDSAEGREFVASKGLLPAPSGVDALRQLQRRDTAVWGKIIRETGMQQ